MSTYPPSDSETDTSRERRLFGRERPIYEVLGGGKGTLIYILHIFPSNKIVHKIMVQIDSVNFFFFFFWL